MNHKRGSATPLVSIALIGAGQLGRRHLQALAKLQYAADIAVVDPSAHALAAARAQFAEMPVTGNIREVRYLSSISDLPGHVDVAITATTADVRADVVRSLLAGCDVEHLVLEKVLFQRPADYQDMEALFAQRGTTAWVNHPRRLFPLYNKMRTWMAGSKQVSYQVQGGAWGLACNGLHFLDHLAYLSGESTLTISGEALDPAVIRSSRAGFVEINGELRGKIGPHPFSIFCHDDPSPVTITICTDKMNATIDEPNGWYRIATKERQWQWTTVAERVVLFQSELSHLVVEDIVDTGRCGLPTYSEAAALHLPFIGCLMHHLRNAGHPTNDACPIT